PLLAGLEIVLSPRRELERHRMAPPHDTEEQHAPREKEQRGPDDRVADDRAVVEQRELAQHEQSGDEGSVERERAASGQIERAAARVCRRTCVRVEYRLCHGFDPSRGAIGASLSLSEPVWNAAPADQMMTDPRSFG